MSQNETTTLQPEQHEAIAVRAYAIWESEGKPDGRDVIHWRQAEQEVLSDALRKPVPVRAEEPAL